MKPYIVADKNVPDGTLRAYDADNRLLVELQIAPVYMATTFLDPESEVHMWRVSPEAAVRYAAMKTWFQHGHYVAGVA